MKKRKILVDARIKILNDEGEKLFDHIRQKIRDERIKQGLSQRALSFEVDRSQNFISKVENGEQEPHILDMIAIAIILRKPLAYFLPPRYRDKLKDVDPIAIVEMKEQRKKAIEALEKLATDQ